MPRGPYPRANLSVAIEPGEEGEALVTEIEIKTPETEIEIETKAPVAEIIPSPAVEVVPAEEAAEAAAAPTAEGGGRRLLRKLLQAASAAAPAAERARAGNRRVFCHR